MGTGWDPRGRLGFLPLRGATSTGRASGPWSVRTSGLWAFVEIADGAIIAEVRQSVRDLEGKPHQGQTHGLKDKTDTFSVFERARWLASTSRMLPGAQTCLEPERYSDGKGDVWEEVGGELS